MGKLIHPPYKKFKGWLVENGVTHSDIGEVLGINKTTVSLKINGQSDFYLSEIQTLFNHYGLKHDIFFTHSVA